MSEFQQVIEDGAKSVGKSFRKLVLRILLIVLIVCLLVGGGYLGYANFTYSKGTRTGNLIKLSQKGVMFKTYEGQLNLGGFQNNSDGISGNIWEFSVPRNEVYELLGKYEGQKVKLYYKEKMQALPWQGKTNYFVYQLEKVD